MDLDVSLTPWQTEVFGSDVRFKVVAAGRRVGKTRLACWKLLINALTTTRGHVYYVAPTQGQARDVIWDMLHELGRPVIVNSHVNNLQVTLVNGVKISLKGSDRPETMRGVSLYYVVLDEYADMKPEVWESILRPALSDLKGGALFIGTPMGRNHFYDICMKAEAGEDPNMKYWHFTSYDNPYLDPSEIEAARASMPEWVFRQEFMASFEAKGSEHFKEGKIQFLDKYQLTSQADTYVAIDLAGFEDVHKRNTSRLDQTAICVTDVSTEGWVVRDMIYGRWDLNETASRIFDVILKYKPRQVGIEKGIAKQAVMSPLTDMMRHNAIYCDIVELTHGNRKKTDRIMWALQGRYENGRIKFLRGDWNAKLMDQLFQFPDPLTHDDLIDALAYIDQLASVAYYPPEELVDSELLDVISGY